jgi:hypothetical protein
MHSRTTTCPTVLDPTSLLRWAPLLPCAPRLWTSPPCSGGLQCCHVSHGYEPRLTARKGSDTATCHMASDLASLLRRAPVLSRVTRLWTPPPCSRGLWFCHMPHGSRPCLLTQEGSSVVTCHATLKNKERLSSPTYAARLACFQYMSAHCRDTCKTCK